MPTCDYIDACCGAGKTTAMVKHVAAQTRKGGRFIILQPTRELISRTVEQFRERGVFRNDTLEVIHIEDGKESVTKRLHAFLTHPGNIKVLLATVDGWRGLHGRKPKDWHLIVDEAPAVFSITSIGSKSVAHRIFDHLDFHSADKHGYQLITVKDGANSKLKDLIDESKTDSALLDLKETANSLLYGLKTHVSEISYTSFSQKGGQMTFYHVMKPSIFRGFNSITIMSANFTDTLLYRIWSSMGVRFVQKSGFGTTTISSTHPREVGEALDIYYLVDEWSAIKKKSSHANTYESEFRRAVREVFGSEKFIYTINGGDDAHMLQGIANAEYVSPKAHGRNDFKHLHCAAVYAHFNQSADRVGFLSRQFGIDKDECWDLLNRDYYYQFVCRISLRETPSAGSLFGVDPKKVIVMDKDMAIYLQSKFPGSKVIKFESKAIDAIPVEPRGRKPINGTATKSTQRSATCRSRAKTNDLNEKLALLSGSLSIPETNLSPRICNENTLDNKKNHLLDETNMKKEEWPIAMIGNIKSTDIVQETESEWSSVSAWLKKMSQRKLQSKNSNHLFCLTQFREENGKIVNRQCVNVIRSHALLMDMDSEKNCCPHAFSDLLRGTEMIIYSSFSSTVTHQRWRVVIPFSRPVTEQEYNRIAKDVLTVTSHKGFDFDNKKRANDFMYLPGIGKDPDAFMFEHFAGEGRRMLEVDRWLSI